MKTVLIYVRDGTENELEQEKYMEGVATAMGLRTISYYEGETGNNLDRLVERAKRKEFVELWCMSAGDVSGDPARLCAFIDALHAVKCGFRVVDEFLSRESGKETDAWKLMRRVLGWVDEGRKREAKTTITLGVERARKRGVLIGRPKMTSKETIERYKEVVMLLEAGHSMREASIRQKLAIGTVFRIRKAMDERVSEIAGEVVEEVFAGGES